MPTSPESQYLLDGAIEHLEITPDVYWSCLLGFLDLDGLADRMDAERRGWHQWDWSDRLVAAAEEWWATAPDGHRYMVALHSLHGFGHFTGEVAHYAACEAADLTPEGIRATMTTIPMVRRWCGQMDTMLRRVCEALQGLRGPQDLLPYSMERQRREEERQQAMVRIHEAIARGETVPPRKRPLRDTANHRVVRQEERRARKVLRRSAAIGERVVGRPAVRAILRGDKAVIEGTRYDYHVEPTYSLLKQAAKPEVMQHPFRINIHRKGDGVRLAYGCVYFEGTPALDQLVALALHVRDREAELDLLRTANLSNFTPSYTEEPTLMEIAAPPPPCPLVKGERLGRLFPPEQEAKIERARAAQPMALDALRERLGLSVAAFEALRVFSLNDEWFVAPYVVREGSLDEIASVGRQVIPVLASSAAPLPIASSTAAT